MSPSQRLPDRGTRRHGPQGSRVVIAVTADDDRYMAVRHVAADLARREDARLILYDWDSPAIFGDPLPSAWSADGTDRSVPDELDERQLFAAGRSTIASQVTDARSDGLTVTAWLPSTHDPQALALYAQDHGATTVVVPSDIPGLFNLSTSFEASNERGAAETPPTVRVVDVSGG